MTNNSLRLSKGKLFQSSTLGLNAKASARGKHKKASEETVEENLERGEENFPVEIYLLRREARSILENISPSREVGLWL
jgi:hypothetical protein